MAGLAEVQGGAYVVLVPKASLDAVLGVENARMRSLCASTKGKANVFQPGTAGGDPSGRFFIFHVSGETELAAEALLWEVPQSEAQRIPLRNADMGIKNF